MTVRILYLKNLDSLVFQDGLGLGLVLFVLGFKCTGLVNTIAKQLPMKQPTPGFKNPASNI